MTTWRKDAIEKSFRVYVTQCLMILTQNTAHYYAGVAKDGSPQMFDYGAHVNELWYELIHPREPEPEDNRTVEEVVDDIWANIERR